MSTRVVRALDALVLAATELRDAITGSSLATLAQPEAVMTTMTTTTTLPLLLTQIETAALLGIHPRTLQRMRASGQGPKPIRVGGSLRYRRSDIERWLEGKRT